MTHRAVPTTRRWRRLMLTLAALFLVLGPGIAAAQEGSVLRVATIGEPPMLDSIATTAASTAAIAQHIWETLYTVDENWALAPMLAERLPDVSEDGRVFTIPLRQGVLFHDGTTMTANDVVASLERWLEQATRGRGTAPYVEAIEATGDYTVTIRLNERYSPLIYYLSMNTASASIMPRALAETEGALTEYVGTGPFQFLEWRPDRYIRLVRFEDYQARAEAPSAYGGQRSADVDEIQFIPVPDANTRLAGLLGGEYDFAEGLNTESLPRLESASDVEPVIVRPFAYPVMIFNIGDGALTDTATRLAVQAALDLEGMLLAGLGSPEFYSLQGSWYPEGSPFYTEAGVEFYNNYDPARASELREQSPYNGEPIRILTSQQYEFLYRMSIVAAENLRAAGFEVDLQVLEWATLIERRNDPTLWEAYWTYGNFYPEPTSYSFLVGAGAGNWSPQEKLDILAGMNDAIDEATRVEWWSRLQELLYTEAPVVRIGEMYGLTGHRTNVQPGEGHFALPIPYYWNVSIR